MCLYLGLVVRIKWESAASLALGNCSVQACFLPGGVVQLLEQEGESKPLHFFCFVLGFFGIFST